MVDDPQNAKQLESRLRSACMRVTTLLGQGTAWPAQVVLQQFPELAESEESAIEIIYTEFQTLEELGQRPDVQQWLQNYPAYRQRLQRLIKLHDLLDEPSASDSPSMTSPKVDGRLDTIGNYELLEELGRGGMGVVYRARQRGLSRHVAVKILKSDDDLVTSRWRFQQEAESIAALQHPHVVQVFETGTDGERDYLSMELIEGGSLDTWMQGPSRSNHEIALLIKYLADAIEYAHRQGIVHRDLKPANVLLTTVGQLPKVVDFGLAKRINDSARLQTQTGAIIGTPSYMSPEQASGGGTRVGPASDIFSLGVILYQLLTRQLPFYAPTTVETLQRIVDSEPIPPCKLQGTVPHDLETICLKCLAKEPLQRYATAQALADDLSRFLDHRPILARRASWWEKSWRTACRHREVTALAIAVLVLAIFGTSIFAWQRNSLAAALREADKQAQIISAEKNRASQAEQAYESSVQRARELLGRTTALGVQLEFEPGFDQTRRKAFEDAVGYYEEFLEKHASDPSIRVEASQAAMRSASLHADLGMWTEAEARFQRANDWLLELPSGDQAQWLRSECLLHLANIQRRLERWSQAETTFNELIGMLNQMIQSKSDHAHARIRLANAQTNLCVILRTQKRWDESLPIYFHGLDNCLQACRSILKLPLTTQPHDTDDLTEQIQQYVAQSTALREHLPSHPSQAKSRLLQSNGLAELALGLDDIAISLKAKGQTIAAEQAMRESIALRQTILQNTQNNRFMEQYTARGMTNLAAHLNDTGRHQEALPWLEAAENIFSALARDFPERVNYRSELAYCLIYIARALNAQQMYAPASEKAEQSVKLREQLAAQNPAIEMMREDLAYSLTTWAMILAANRQTARAKEIYERVIDMQPERALACNNLAWLLATEPLESSQSARPEPAEGSKSQPDDSEREPLERNKWERSVELARRAVQVAEQNPNYWNTYTLALYRAGHYAEGLTAAAKAQTLTDGGTIVDWYFQAMLLAKLGHSSEAQVWFRRAELRRLDSADTDPETKLFAEEAAAIINP